MSSRLDSLPARAAPSGVFALRQLACGVLAGLAGGASAWAAAAASGGGTAADQAWNAVSALHRTAVEVRVNKVRGLVAADRAAAARVRSERETRARQHRAAAAAAREFYVRHPEHPRVTEARRLAVLADLEGITPWDAAHERAALAAAAAFRADRTQPTADRYAVAHAVESREITRRTLGRPWYQQPVLAERMLDRLQTEFGDRPEVWAGYVALAAHASCDAGREVAYRVLQSPAAPDSAQAAARRVLARYALVRRPLDFPLAPVQGRPTTLGALAGRTTVVCVWDGAKQPGGPPGLHEFKRQPRSDTTWVYVSLGTPPAAAPGKGKGRARTAAMPPGALCIEPLGWRSPLVEKLQLTQLPYVYVLDEHRRLSGYGRLDEIPALLAGIGRPALP